MTFAKLSFNQDFIKRTIMINKQNFLSLKKQDIQLIAVSKMKTVEDIEALYALGQRDFGENYVQELLEKYEYFKYKEKCLDINWHFIGHLQSNKVKYIAPFVHLIHGIDSFKLLKEVNKQATKHKRLISCLLQMHIAEENSKFGMDEKEIIDFMSFYEAQKETLTHVKIEGMMGMASFSNNKEKVRQEFRRLKTVFDITKNSFFIEKEHFRFVSMGMSDDYQIAIQEGANMIRIGSLLFGKRQIHV